MQATYYHLLNIFEQNWRKTSEDVIFIVLIIIVFITYYVRIYNLTLPVNFFFFYTHYLDLMQPWLRQHKDPFSPAGKTRGWVSICATNI